MTNPDRWRSTRRAIAWDAVTEGARLEYTAPGAEPVVVRITGRHDDHLTAPITGRKADELRIDRAHVDAGRVARVPSRRHSPDYADDGDGVTAWCKCCGWETSRPQSTKAAAEYSFQTHHGRAANTAEAGR